MCLMAKKPKYKKTKMMCNEFSKDFKDGPHKKKKPVEQQKGSDVP